MSQSETVTLYKPEGMDVVIFEPTELYIHKQRVWLQFNENTTIERRKTVVHHVEVAVTKWLDL